MAVKRDDSIIENSVFSEIEDTERIESIDLIARRERSVLWLTVREGRRLVLKGLPEELRSHPEEEARLRKEYSLGMRLNHPSVATVYGYETREDTGPVIVMEYVEGTTLDKYLAGNPHLPLTERWRMACRIADALAYIHSHGMCHRDLKPDNILVSSATRDVKIIDLGLGDSADFVTYKISAATKSYGAPEQLKGARGDACSDVYSLGKILQLLLPERKYDRIRRQCLQDDPASRSGMADVAHELTNILPKAKRGGWIWAVCAVIFSTVTVGGVWFMKERESDSVQKVMIPESTAATIAVGEESKVKSEENKKKSVESRVGEPSGMPVRPDVSVLQSINQEENSAKEQPVVPAMPAMLTGQSPVELQTTVRRYIAEIDKDIEKYGELPYLDPEEKRYEELEGKRKRRTARTFELSDRLEKELKDAGYDQSEIDKAYHTYWTHVVFATNRIDGCDEIVRRQFEQNR